MPLISVIVPIYKVEAYLDKCVQSIIDQTYRNLEIILVDDGSPDNCPQMCDAWTAKDDRIKVIHKENGGLSDARNAGLAIASGEYIAFVDSDDWLTDSYMSFLYRGISETNADICACDVFFTYGEEPERSDKQDWQCRVCKTEDAIRDILQGSGFRAVACNKLYHRNILKGEQYPVGKHHEDEFLTYKLLAKAERLAYVNTPLYCYYQRSDSIMRSASIRRLDALDAHFERLEFLKEYYPQLYLEDKFSYCTACVSFYRNSFISENTETDAIRNKLKKCRRKISFQFSEMKKANLRQLIYVAASRISLHCFSSILYHLHKD